jgi:chemoreceptor-like protein with four helix bundle sensory module
VDKNLKAVESSLATANGKQTFAALMTAIGEYQTARDEVLALSGQGKQQEAYALNKQKVLPRVTRPSRPSRACSTPRWPVSAATQETSASAQEIAASAQTLSSIAEQLNGLVRRFTLV